MDQMSDGLINSVLMLAVNQEPRHADEILEGAVIHCVDVIVLQYEYLQLE